MADETTPQSSAPSEAPESGPEVPASTPSNASAGRGPSVGGGHGQSRHAGPRPVGGLKRGKRNYPRKKKVCRFCMDKADYIDYKKADVLQSFVQDRGKILPRRITGTCAKHQRWLTVAIKRARNIALMPFATEM
jgi:small subunit ribosomal protein S18